MRAQRSNILRTQHFLIIFFGLVFSQSWLRPWVEPYKKFLPWIRKSTTNVSHENNDVSQIPQYNTTDHHISNVYKIEVLSQSQIWWCIYLNALLLLEWVIRERGTNLWSAGRCNVFLWETILSFDFKMVTHNERWWWFPCQIWIKQKQQMKLDNIFHEMCTVPSHWNPWQPQVCLFQISRLQPTCRHITCMHHL